MPVNAMTGEKVIPHPVHVDGTWAPVDVVVPRGTVELFVRANCYAGLPGGTYKHILSHAAGPLAIP